MLNDKEKNLLFSIVRIEIANRQAAGASIGTGFIVSIPVPNVTGSSFLFLVSNKHVFVDPTHDISLVFTKRCQDAVEPDLGTVTTISQSGFMGGYVCHPDPSVDLACINISRLGEPSLGLYFRHYSSDHFLEEASQDLSVGQDVFFIGYPENRFDVVHNLPLLRKGCIASAPYVDFNGQKQMLIDAHVFQGSSGSPVFAASNGEFKIAGVISQTMIKNSVLQAIPVGTALGMQQFVGLGIVLKVALIKELLAYAAQHFGHRSI